MIENKNGNLKYKNDTLTCVKCKKVYKIEDNIPILIWTVSPKIIDF